MTRHSPRRIRLFAALALLAGLAGCGALSAQNPSSSLKPVNAVQMPPAKRVMLQGADVVAYFTAGAFRSGIAEHQSQFEGVSFWFASAEHKALFDQSPERYLPQFGGYCASGISYGIPWGGDADTWKLIDGKLYIFGGQSSKDAWELDEPTNLALAKPILGRRSARQQQLLAARQAPGVACAALQDRGRTGARSGSGQSGASLNLRWVARH